MAIVSALTNIANGDPRDAVPLMADLNQLKNQVNANAFELTAANTASGANIFSGNNTFSGANTFSANNAFSGANTFSGNNKYTGTITGSVDTTKRMSFDPDTLVATGTTNKVDAFPTGTKLVFAQAVAPLGWTQDASNDQVLRVVSGAGGGSGGTLSIASANTGAFTLTAAEIPAHTHAITDPGHHHTTQVMANWGSINDMAGGNAATQPINTPSTSTATTGISLANTGGGGSHTHPLAIKYQDVIICSKN